jgi:hypothetical protein
VHGRRRSPPRGHYGWLLDLVAAKRAAQEGRHLHAHALATGSLDEDGDGFLATKLVFMNRRCGRVDDARRLFDGMPTRTVFSWNALVGAYLLSVLKACGAEVDGRCGREVHGLVVKTGLDRSTELNI